MTKVFSVVYDVGSYSDRSVNLLGVFSSEERAQAFIDEKSYRPDAESKREEWLLTKQSDLLIRIKRKEDGLYSLNTTLVLYEKEVKRVGNPDFHRNNIKRTKEYIDSLTNSDPNIEPYYLQTLEAYVSSKYWSADKNDFSILESTLDVEIK